MGDRPLHKGHQALRIRDQNPRLRASMTFSAEGSRIVNSVIGCRASKQALLSQSSTETLAKVVIHPKQSNRCKTGLRQSHDYDAGLVCLTSIGTQAEVVTPSMLSRMEQWNGCPGGGVNAGQIGALLEIAMPARQRKVVG